MIAETYLRRGEQTLRRWLLDFRVRKALAAAGYALAGFLLSGAALRQAMMPLAMGLVCAGTGWRALLMGAGSALGYRIFWGEAGLQGVVWTLFGTLTALFLGKRKTAEALLPVLAAFLVSGAGLVFQLALGDKTPFPVYLLRIATAAAGTLLFRLAPERKPVTDWLTEGVFVLGLAQAAPVPVLNPGLMAAAVLALKDAFPPAALAGLALDLSGITPVPMTAAVSLAWLTRRIPGLPGWLRCLCPGAVYLAVMGVCGCWDPLPLAALTAGGFLSTLLPPRPEAIQRQGEIGLAQVRLELMAEVLSQTQQLLIETGETAIDEEALVLKAADRACGSCPARKSCQADRGQLTAGLLHLSLGEGTVLPLSCRKPGRMMLELRRSQEQLRSMKADRDRQREYRSALIQQYRFLSEYLHQLSDQLPRRGEQLRTYYRVEVGICTAGKESANGDRCLRFSGTQCRYYVLLCDGVGTGTGAAQEGQSAAQMLRRMLTAGFPAEYALRSLNSLCCLRHRGGAVTVDLAEIRLDTGRVAIFKWGAAASYVLRAETAEKIGTAGPPPGLSVEDNRETVDRLSLRRGEVLILLSDGVDGEVALRREEVVQKQTPGELAQRLLEYGTSEGSDDATAAVIRLVPTGT